MDRMEISFKTLALLCLLVALVLSGAAAGEVSREGLVGEWHFNGDAKDSSGNGNDGAIHGASFVDGISGKALSFNGVNDYVEKISASGVPQGSNPITITFWTKPPIQDTDAYFVMIGEMVQDGMHTVSQYHSSSMIEFAFYGNDLFPKSSVLIINEWNYITATYDGKTRRIYVNGKEIASDNPTPPNIRISNIYIGKGSSKLQNDYFKGVIDEVRIYNRALSADEIKANYEEYITPQTPKPTITKSSYSAPSLSNSGGGSWQYSKEITIRENSSSTLTDYQVLVPLSGSGFPSNARSDGTDIRFTDASGNELSYWLESWDYAGRNAKVWVKVPSITAGATASIHMYYGNPRAGNSSNGDKTFEFFDDFSTKDNSKWNVSDWIIENEQAKLIPTIVTSPGNDWGILDAPLNLSISSIGYSVKYRIILNSPGIWNWDIYNNFSINGIEYGTDILQEYNACNYFFHLNGPDCGINEVLFLDTRNWHTYEFVILSNSLR